MNKQTNEQDISDMLNKLDPPYKSKQELEIGHILDQYGLPFLYRQPTIVMTPYEKKNEIWHPSFTLPRYRCSVIDYTEDPADQQEKIMTYLYNQIPATVLGPKDLSRPAFTTDLYNKLKEQFSQFNNPLAYMIK